MKREEFESRIIAMQDTLYRVSATILHQSCDREDAIQECIYKATLKREKLKDDRAMQSWVIRILINECYAILRHKKRNVPVENIPEPQMPPDADPNIFRILFSLEDKWRLPLVLYHVEGYSTEKIASILRIPQGTVRSRLTRARDKLKTMLKEQEAADE